jgi:ribosomal protein S18 acetylase RimI-like enzyme
VVSVTEVRQADGELLAAVRRLLPQLSSSAREPSDEEIGEIVASPATVLLVARDDTVSVGRDSSVGRDGTPLPAPVPVEDPPAPLSDASGSEGPIVGMVTLVLFRLPTGMRAWVEDVVVDTAARRRGVAETLTRAAVEVARARGAKTVDLTSRPSREAANNLYRKVGFQERDTNVYRIDLRTDS